MAELARRGIEYILSVYSEGDDNWVPPKPRSMGWKGLSDREIKEQAQRTANEIEMVGGGRK